MKIAVLHFHRLGGSGIVAYEIGCALAKQGHEIHFIGLHFPFRHSHKDSCCQDRVFFHKISIQQYEVFDFQPYALALASQVAAIINKYSIDTIHSHYAIPHAICAILAKKISKRKVKCVTTLHGTDITIVGSHSSMKNITRYAIEESDEVTAVSRYLKEKTESIFSIPKNKIKVIYNFINPLQENIKIDVSKKLTEKIIFHSSNLREVKNPLKLIELFYEIQKNIPEISLWIIGDGPLRSKMVSKIKNYGIEKKVFFKGIIKDIFPTLRQATITMIPSLDESFSLTALESISCGVPVIANNVGGLKEVLSHGETGYLINENNTEQVVRHFCNLLNDEFLYSKVSNYCLERAKKLFHIKNIISQYEKIL